MSHGKTDYQIRLGKEDRARGILRRKFGMRFGSGSLPNSGTNHEFAAVSEDGRIIAEVKSNGLNKVTSALRPAVRDNFTTACVFLLTTKAKRKLLVLTDKGAYDHYLKTVEARASRRMGIEIVTQGQIMDL